MPLVRTAALARRTTPGPKSTRYTSSSTTMAVAGPDRSGSGPGVPVPSSTTRGRIDGAVAAGAGWACETAIPATRRKDTNISLDLQVAAEWRERGGEAHTPAR